ncbi:GNAT family N-acetyltransferase [Oenococcus kitaharae]|uniref:GNAT family Acetyltransferase n=1 Tax=Oenococcus kitaharae DSM 17330 TaxID=1045004 RepID=G9WGG4_9LACO|nr:GNAT family N-acetyltransferase [Oenococcus kitaharae]EHN59791.1 GNAT family Acetyltransferase [Oenococcus kitaharae DSM 17330]OEY83610.1 acetyltransferase [Oenococcus kitaharae]OEY85408.1 acetyltransferase [Oenococcus kitaharae]OEY86261.1 acetyltransferase [Oenococcus kitaharae]
MAVAFRKIKFHSSDKQYYDENLVLRNDVLRKPIGKTLNRSALTIEKDNQFYGLLLKDELLATLSVYALSPTKACLVAFAVRPDFQKQGLGTELLKFVLTDLKTAGYTSVTLTARASAHDFYLKNAFKDLGPRHHDSRLNIDDYEMSLDL